MAAITWQNVNAPSDSAAIIGMDIAGKTVNSAFDKFNQALLARQAAAQLALDKQDAAGILATKEMLAGVTNPEEALALQSQIIANNKNLSVDARTKLLTAGLDRQVALRAQGDANQVAALNAIKDPVAIMNAQAAAERAPEENKQARDALDNKARVAEATQKQAVVDAERSLTDSLFKTQQTPIAQTIAAKTNQINNVVADTTQITSKDTLEDTLLGKQADELANRYRESQLANKTALGQIAVAKGMPVDKLGNVDYLNLTPQQKLELNSEAIINNLPTIEQLAKGDTEARNKAYQALSKSNSPSAMLRNEARLNSVFNTFGVGAPIGNEAAILAQRDAQQKVIEEENDRNNWHSPGKPDTKQAYDKIRDRTVKIYTDSDRERYLPAIHRMLTKVATEGIDVDGVRLTPSEQDMNAAVDATLNNLMWTNSGRADDILDEVKKNLNTEQAKKSYAQREQSIAYKRTQAVKELLNPTSTKK